MWLGPLQGGDHEMLPVGIRGGAYPSLLSSFIISVSAMNDVGYFDCNDVDTGPSFMNRTACLLPS
jgi:hypothetical protein